MTTAAFRFSLHAQALLIAACVASCGKGGSGSSTVPELELAYANDDLVLATGAPLAPMAPEIDAADWSWTVEPALPAGLVLDPGTGVVSGQPTAASPRAWYTVRASSLHGIAERALRVAVADPIRFAYVSSDADDTISAFTYDALDGGLARRDFSATSVGEAAPGQLVVHPLGNWAFSPNEASGNVTTWSLDVESGRLTKVDVDELGAGPHAVAIHPGGRLLYAVDLEQDLLVGFAFDPVLGVLERLEATVPTGTRPTSLAFDASGRFLFVATSGAPGNGAGSGVQTYAVGSRGGLVPRGQPFKLYGGRPSTLVADPNRQVLYATLDAFDALVVLGYDDTGTLNGIQLRPAGDGVCSLAVHPFEPRLYTVARGEGSLRCFSIDEATLQVAEVSSQPAGLEPVQVVVDTLGERLLTISRGSRELASWMLGDGSQPPAKDTSFALRGTPNKIGCAVGDRPSAWLPCFVHVVATESEQVSSYTIDGSDGSVDHSGAVELPGRTPSSIVLDARLRHAFVVTAADGAISRYAVDPTSGALTPRAGDVSVLGRIRHIAVELSGRFLYGVAEEGVEGNGKLHAWAIDQVTGELAHLGASATGAHPRQVAVDPTGEFIYVLVAGAGQSSPTMNIYRADARTGLAFAGASMQLADMPSQIAFHPSARWMHLPMPGLGLVSRFEIERASGALVPRTDASPAFGPEPCAVAFSADGKWGYIAYKGGAGLGMVTRNRVGLEGELEPGSWAATAGANPVALSLAPGNDLLYALNAGGDDMTPYLIQGDGTLANQTNVLVGLQPSGLSVTGITR
jgi:6-phosphogluconolactonase (cycloisomerase 2 family)